jgi:hypothetical protein
MPRVTYVPSQTANETSFTSTRSAVIGPLTLFFHDIRILFRNLKYTFYIVLPLRIPAHRPGVRYYLTPIVANESLLYLSIFYEIILLLVTVVAILILPGFAFAIFFLLTTSIVVMLAAPGWGSRTVASQNAKIDPGRFPHERWVFLNGVTQR